jgi:hypothetical protein
MVSQSNGQNTGMDLSAIRRLQADKVKAGNEPTQRTD